MRTTHRRRGASHVEWTLAVFFVAAGWGLMADVARLGASGRGRDRGRATSTAARVLPAPTWGALGPEALVLLPAGVVGLVLFLGLRPLPPPAAPRPARAPAAVAPPAGAAGRGARPPSGRGQVRPVRPSRVRSVPAEALRADRSGVGLDAQRPSPDPAGGPPPGDGGARPDLASPDLAAAAHVAEPPVGPAALADFAAFLASPEPACALALAPAAGASPDAARRDVLLQPAQRCPFCHDRVAPEEPLTRCPDCRAVFHAECRAEGDPCTTLGCA